MKQTTRYTRTKLKQRLKHKKTFKLFHFQFQVQSSSSATAVIQIKVCMNKIQLETKENSKVKITKLVN